MTDYNENGFNNYINFTQFNTQNSVNVTTEARKIKKDRAINFLIIQEPYSAGVYVKGFGMATSNKVIGNRSEGTRPMAKIVCRSSLQK